MIVEGFESQCHQDWAGQGYSNENGYFTVILPAGQYYIYANPQWISEPYVNEWWDGNDGTFNCNQAIAVNVIAGQDTPNINFAVKQGGVISGRVTNQAGQPIPNVCVDAVVDNPCQWNCLGGAQSDENGQYTIIVPGGYYYVRASPSCNYQNFVLEWWNGGAGSVDCNQASPVAASVGHETDGIDFTLEPGGSASGRVTDAQGNAISNLHVYAMSQNCGGHWLAGNNTDPNGNYRLTGLPQGNNFVITCADCSGLNYINEYYDNVTDCNQASPVLITVGQDTPGINFALEEGGSLSGRVTDALGNPMGNVPVSIYHNRCWNGWAGGTQTDSNGGYTVLGLAVGDYFVIVQPKCGIPGNFNNEWWDGGSGSPACNMAASVDITAGQETGGINFSLNGGSPYPAPTFDYAGIFSQNRADGGSGTAIFAFVSGPSPDDVCSFTATGPSGTFHLNPSISFQDLGLMYWGGQDYIVDNGTYVFTITDSLGRSASILREFQYDNTLPFVDSATMNPPDMAYVEGTTPTLSFSPVFRAGVSYQMLVEDLAGKAVWYNQTGMESTSVTLPHGVLQPNTAYKWYVRVRDVVGIDVCQNVAQSPSLRFFTGNGDAPLLESQYIGLLNNPPHGENMGTWLGVISRNTAPWDVDTLTVKDPGGFVHEWNGSINYWFCHPAFFSWYFQDPIPFADGTYTLTMKDTASCTGAVGADYQYMGPVPPVSEESRKPTPNAYLDTDTPIFSWTPLTGMGTTYEYRVRIRDYSNRIIWYDSTFTPETTRTIPPILPRGSSYLWEVMAKPVGGTDIAYSAQWTFTLNPFRYPKPDIKVNNQNGPVFVNPTVASNIGISLDPGDLPGERCDWWIGALTPFGTYWFTYPSCSWVPSGAPICVGQISLMNLAPYQVLSYNLPTGIYTFFFILDKNPNGVLDDLSWYDYVNVFSSPKGLEMAIPSMSGDNPEKRFINKIEALMKQ